GGIGKSLVQLVEQGKGLVEAALLEELVGLAEFILCGMALHGNPLNTRSPKSYFSVAAFATSYGGGNSTDRIDRTDFSNRSYLKALRDFTAGGCWRCSRCTPAGGGFRRSLRGRVRPGR